MFFDISNPQDQQFIDRLPLLFNRILTIPNMHPFMEIHQIICEEYIGQNSFYGESVDYLVKYFLIKLSECMNTDYSRYDHALFERISELRRLIYNSPSRKWTVNTMAAQVSLSPSYFQSVYKKFFHISCMEDLFTSRMNYARQLLAVTNLPINEIAGQCGYESNIYFSRHFKKKAGMTPTEYRRLWREQPGESLVKPHI